MLLEELEKHLSLLQRQGMIAGWHRHKIVPGDNRNQVSEEQFSSAQIILLLISPDFLALDTSYTEMERALQRYEDWSGTRHPADYCVQSIVNWLPLHTCKLFLAMANQ